MALRRLAVALGERELVALVPEGGAPRVVEIDPFSRADDPAPALRRAFARLGELLAPGGGAGDEPAAAPPRLEVRVALLPPLCDVRLISLPPLRQDELDAVLRREAPRHFLGGARPLVVAGTQYAGRAGRAPVLAAAAPRALLEGVQKAVEAQGWTLERCVPAHAAWVEALEAVLPPERSAGEGSPPPPRLLVAVEGSTAHLIRWEGRAPERVRRLPLSELEGLAEAAGPEGGSALLLAGGEARRSVAAVLESAGWTLLAGRPAGADARTEAARHAGDAFPELAPPQLVRARREKSRRASTRMVAASLVILAAAAGVHLWGQVREYRAVQRERSELRPLVAPALAARDSLDRLNERFSDLQALAGQSARWTFALVEISVLLPPETHLVSLRAAGDTAVVEAQGGRAGDALAALRTAATLQDVRMEGNIQRDLEGGTTSRERFTLSAVLARARRPRPAAERAPHAEPPHAEPEADEPPRAEPSPAEPAAAEPARAEPGPPPPGALP